MNYTLFENAFPMSNFLPQFFPNIEIVEAPPLIPPTRLIMVQMIGSFITLGKKEKEPMKKKAKDRGKRKRNERQRKREQKERKRTERKRCRSREKQK